MHPPLGMAIQTLLLVLVTALTFSSPALPASTSSRLAEEPAALSHMDPLWQTYVNARFAFAVRFPATWTVGRESDNGDGVRFETGDPAARGAVYAGYILEASDAALVPGAASHARREPLTLASGREAMMLIDEGDGLIRKDLVVQADGVEYHIVLAGPEPFFRANEAVLQEFLRSLEVR